MTFNRCQFFKMVEGRYQVIPLSEAISIPIRTLINGPYILRVSTTPQEFVYFTGTDATLMKHLSDQGKTTLWLHDIFEGFRLELVARGLPEKSIYGWTLQAINAHLTMFDIFPDGKVVR